MKEFKIPRNIYLTSLNYDTGMKSSPGEKNVIIEALKLEDINNIENNNNGESQISSIPAANSLIYKFEHGERLKLEQEENPG